MKNEETETWIQGSFESCAVGSAQGGLASFPMIHEPTIEQEEYFMKGSLGSAAQFFKKLTVLLESVLAIASEREAGAQRKCYSVQQPLTSGFALLLHAAVALGKCTQMIEAASPPRTPRTPVLRTWLLCLL